jgi:hypothetical protein
MPIARVGCNRRSCGDEALQAKPERVAIPKIILKAKKALKSGAESSTIPIIIQMKLNHHPKNGSQGLTPGFIVAVYFKC